MYTEQDFLDIRRRISRYGVALTAVLAALIAVFCVSLIRRFQAGVMISAALLAVAAVFGLGFFIIPCQRYLKFLTDLRDGLSREMAGTVVSVAEAAEPQDGALVLPVHLLLRDEDDERIIYLNASKRELFPGPGAQVRVKLCGRHIRDVEAM